MASSSFLVKLARSFSRTTGTWSRANAGGVRRGFATYELSDKENTDDDNTTDEESKQNQNQNENNESKFQGKTFQENADAGLYRAIILGEVGQLPVQKKLKNGRVITNFSVGTGGIRNNRRPLENESPKEYADRGTVQWHRVSIYSENLGSLAMKRLKQGAQVYLEGNLEMKVFSDPITGMVKRVREISIRQKGRLIFLTDGTDSTNANSEVLKTVGYF